MAEMQYVNNPLNSQAEIWLDDKSNRKSIEKMEKKGQNYVPVSEYKIYLDWIFIWLYLMIKHPHDFIDPSCEFSGFEGRLSPRI